MINAALSKLGHQSAAVGGGRGLRRLAASGRTVKSKNWLAGWSVTVAPAGDASPPASLRFLRPTVLLDRAERQLGFNRRLHKLYTLFILNVFILSFFIFGKCRSITANVFFFPFVRTEYYQFDLISHSILLFSDSPPNSGLLKRLDYITHTLPGIIKHNLKQKSRKTKSMDAWKQPTKDYVSLEYQFGFILFRLPSLKKRELKRISLTMTWIWWI